MVLIRGSSSQDGLRVQVKSKVHGKGSGLLFPGQPELFQQDFHTSWGWDSAAGTVAGDSSAVCWVAAQSVENKH